MPYVQSTAKGHIRAKQNVYIQNVFLPVPLEVKILIHYIFNTHSTIEG